MIGRAFKILSSVIAASVIIAALVYVTYTETRPERRILVEENYQPPQRPQAATPDPQPADDMMTPMLGDE